ncbi:MAG: ATP-dependent 6-phosphofructokinase [Acidobacteria bacterium]|nr:ATP-dependent 6-phosphofructokinase [Acidobacteriota bacterium]
MPEKPRKRIVVLNGGGDCPGLNAVIRAIVKTGILHYGWDVWGSENTFDGFLKPGKLIPLTLDSVRGILPRGGTILGTTNRGDPFRYPEKDEKGHVVFRDYSAQVIERFRELQFEAMLVIGGDGTLTIGQAFFEAGLPVIGVPKTIDNDLEATEVSFGFDTALHTATDAIDKIHTTAESHDRVMVIEVMGRNAGWIALQAGISGGADVILIPEIPFNFERVCEKVQERARAGRAFSVIVVAEGAAPIGSKKIYRERAAGDPYGKLGGVGFLVGNTIQKRLDVETRVLVLGHLQRGGTPSPFDRLLGTRFGVSAVELASEGRWGQMVSLRCGRIDSAPIREAIAHQRLVDPTGEHVRVARAIGISFGD